MNKIPRVSAIVPCYNEEMYVASTISSLILCPSLFEIITVDDGSKDKTLEILHLFEPRIKVIANQKNNGKGAAMVEGIKRARGQLILFIDGHHLNIEDNHIKAITNPLLKDQADAVLGTTIVRIPDPFWRLTGFRAYWKKDLVPLLPDITTTRFGVEAYLNNHFKNKRVKVLKIKKLVHILKQQKMSPSQALNDYLIEFREVAQELAIIKGVNPQLVRKILNPKKIKTLRSLRIAVKKINDKGIIDFFKEYILQYLNIS
ncbi:MAG: glycosyltransferase family 2 protein [Candidatus Gottesmanbacteria bacterium]